MGSVLASTVWRDKEDGRAVALDTAIPILGAVWPWLAVVIRRNTLLRERNMDIEKRPDGWWITDIPDTLDCGPYGSKAEAAKDRASVARFFEHEDERAFFTVERRAGVVVDDAAEWRGPGGNQRRPG